MQYRYLAEINSASGATLGSVPVRPDWSASREWCHFQGVRDGRRLYFANAGAAVIEPVWHAESGPPLVEGFRVGLTDADGETFACVVSPRFLRADVERAAVDLVARGALGAGEEFGFALCAYPDPDDGERAPPADDGLEGEAVAVRVELQPASLSEAIASSERYGTTHWSDGDLPVFIPVTVIDELQSMARADAQVECGAILIGRLCQDTDGGDERPRVFLQVTAQIPARHTIAERASLTFTAETWAAADGVLRLRGLNEMTTGWAHSHPFFCRNCTESDRLVCPLARPLFSAADVDVHRTVFAHAYEIALLLSFLGEERPRCDLYAWREGQIVPRGFYVC